MNIKSVRYFFIVVLFVIFNINFIKRNEHEINEANNFYKNKTATKNNENKKDNKNIDTVKSESHFTIGNYLDKFERIAKSSHQKIKLLNNVDKNGEKIFDEKLSIKNTINYIDLYSLYKLNIRKDSQIQYLYFNNHRIGIKNIILLDKYCESQDRNSYFSVNENELDIHYNNKKILVGHFESSSDFDSDYGLSNTFWACAGCTIGSIFLGFAFAGISKAISKLVQFYRIYYPNFNIFRNAETIINDSSSVYHECESPSISDYHSLAPSSSSSYHSLSSSSYHSLSSSSYYSITSSSSITLIDKTMPSANESVDVFKECASCSSSEYNSLASSTTKASTQTENNININNDVERTLERDEINLQRQTFLLPISNTKREERVLEWIIKNDFKNNKNID